MNNDLREIAIRTENRYKCPACGGNQYTSADTAEGCIYCGHKELKKMEALEPNESEGLKC